jgi:hypothetical protein
MQEGTPMASFVSSSTNTYPDDLGQTVEVTVAATGGSLDSTTAGQRLLVLTLDGTKVTPTTGGSFAIDRTDKVAWYLESVGVHVQLANKVGHLVPGATCVASTPNTTGAADPLTSQIDTAKAGADSPVLSPLSMSFAHFSLVDDSSADGLVHTYKMTSRNDGKAYVMPGDLLDITAVVGTGLNAPAALAKSGFPIISQAAWHVPSGTTDVHLEVMIDANLVSFEKTWESGLILPQSDWWTYRCRLSVPVAIDD